jgi:hypothetical protein
MVKRRHTRRQRGGAGFSFSGPAFTTAGGVNVESRGGYDHCYSDMRVAPAVNTPTLWGGRRRTRGQRGGNCSSCGPMRGGGAGTGGYSLSYDNNSLGKVYSETVKPGCPQTGGATSIYDLVSYPASYGYNTGSAVLTDSAHYLEPVSGVSRCASGGSRRRSHRRRSHRKSKRSYRRSK